MATGLCQVCARPVPWPDRLLVVSKISVQHVVVRGEITTVLTEPWLDPECAQFAVTRCPGLIRRKTADDLMLVSVPAPSRCGLTISTGWVDGPLERESKRLQPAMWAKIMLRTSP